MTTFTAPAVSGTSPSGRRLLGALLTATLLSCSGVPPGVDAGPADSGVADAGALDAGMLDAGTPDAGMPDAGTPDAGTRIVIAAPECVTDITGRIVPQFQMVPLGTWNLTVRHMGNTASAELAGEVANPVTWDVGVYTGLHVPTPMSNWQRGYYDLGPPSGTNAFQLNCTDYGSMINTWSFDRTEPIVGGGPHSAFSFDVAGDVRPWGGARQKLIFEGEVEIPQVLSVSGGIGQYSFFLYLRDESTRIVVAQLFGIFESRALGVGGSGSEFIGNDTFVNFISGPIEQGTRYSTRAAGSEGFHTQTAFSGLRSFRVEVSRAQLLAGITDINVRRAGAGQALMSTDLANYRITTVGALHEVFVEGLPGAEISMGVHARNIQVSAE